MRHLAQRVVAEAIEHVAQEVRAVDVRRVALRILARVAGNLVEPQLVRAAADRAHAVSRRANVRIEARAAVASARRALRLFVDCDAFDQPARHDLIRRPRRAEDLVVDGRQAFVRIEVKDVGVLVRDQGVEPILVIVELGEARRAGRVDLDRVARQHRREAVRRVGVVDQVDQRLLGRLVIERRCEQRMCVLGDDTEASRLRVERRPVIDHEVLGLDRAPLERRIAGVNDARDEHREREGDRRARAHPRVFLRRRQMRRLPEKLNVSRSPAS
jgi:hypothetical protein